MSEMVWYQDWRGPKGAIFHSVHLSTEDIEPFGRKRNLAPVGSPEEGEVDGKTIQLLRADSSNKWNNFGVGIVSRPHLRRGKRRA